ncbi:MAG: VanW family protein [Candidatus Absconditabacterales bacterium]|nr:VanW family protein [Candidatus Absconditabacterales bacterium]
MTHGLDLDHTFFLELKAYAATHPALSGLDGKQRDINTLPCTIHSGHDTPSSLTVSPGCLVHPDRIPRDNSQWEQKITNLRSYISDFTDVYDLVTTGYAVRPSSPILSGDRSSVSDLFSHHRPSDHFILVALHRANASIRLPTRALDYIFIKSLYYTAVHKPLAGIGACGLTNYLIGFRALDGVRLLPGRPFNINSHIAYLPGYCSYDGPDYMFNGGACGISTHLFRNALMHPHLMITERHNHSKRWAYYYGPYIHGDDAAIYENSKRLIIENTGPHPILLKTIERDDETYLVTITLPSDHTQNNVWITKKQTGRLTSLVEKKVINQSQEIIHTEAFPSTFRSIRRGP